MKVKQGKSVIRLFSKFNISTTISMKRSRPELFIDIAVHRDIFWNNQIVLYPCFTFIPKAGMGLPETKDSICCELLSEWEYFSNCERISPHRESNVRWCIRWPTFLNATFVVKWHLLISEVNRNSLKSCQQCVVIKGVDSAIRLMTLTLMCQINMANDQR